MRYQMKTRISVTLRRPTSVSPENNVIQSNVAFRAGVNLHLHRVHILVILVQRDFCFT